MRECWATAAEDRPTFAGVLAQLTGALADAGLAALPVPPLAYHAYARSLSGPIPLPSPPGDACKCGCGAGGGSGESEAGTSLSTSGGGEVLTDSTYVPEPMPTKGSLSKSPFSHPLAWVSGARDGDHAVRLCPLHAQGLLLCLRGPSCRLPQALHLLRGPGCPPPPAAAPAPALPAHRFPSGPPKTWRDWN